MKRSKFIKLAASSMAATTFLSFPAFSKTRQQGSTFSDFFIKYVGDEKSQEQAVLLKVFLNADPDLKSPIFVGHMRNLSREIGCTYIFNKLSEPSKIGEYIRYNVKRNEEKTYCSPGEGENSKIYNMLETTSFIDFKPRTGNPLPNSKYEMARLVNQSEDVMYELGHFKTEEEGCFLTTACVAHKGLPDNCDELQKLRAFRDNFMRNHPEGKELITDYYILAPAIVSELNKEQRVDVYDFIYNELVLKCIDLIENDKPELAMYYYKSFTEELSQKVLN